MPVLPQRLLSNAFDLFRSRSATEVASGGRTADRPPPRTKKPRVHAGEFHPKGARPGRRSTAHGAPNHGAAISIAQFRLRNS
jgi:hypothetical protein